MKKDPIIIGDKTVTNVIILLIPKAIVIYIYNTLKKYSIYKKVLLIFYFC